MAFKNSHFSVASPRSPLGANSSFVRDAAVSLLDPLIDAGWVAVCRGYAQKFPAQVFAEFFKLPVDVSVQIKEVSGTYVDAIQVVDKEAVLSLSKKPYEMAQMVIDDRKAGDYDQEVVMTAVGPGPSVGT